VYASKLSVYDFRCFGKAILDLQYPGRSGMGTSELSNVNLILGDNGGGKSSILRAIAIAVLAPVLLESGFVANRMVRRPGAKTSLVKVKGLLESREEETAINPNSTHIEMLARFEARDTGSRDRLHLDSTPKTPIEERIFDDYSPEFFLVGYGATRRVETGDFSESSARRSRGLRYQRVAGLFEDHVALRPLQTWFSKLSDERKMIAASILSAILPDNITFSGEFDTVDEQFIFEFNGKPTPFSSLSDGYKAFIGMAGDLIGHLSDVTSDMQPLELISGIVLIDEIDLHLHPEWQRTILPSLAKAFPRLQFVCTTHSPLVASTVRKENVYVTATAEDGTATIQQIEEKVYGRSAEQLLLSSYFGLQSTRPETFMDDAQSLFRQAADGDSRAALEFLDRLASPLAELETKASRQAANRLRISTPNRDLKGAS
jgi:predicted ATPase